MSEAAKPEALAVGAQWEIKSKDHVKITRPDGTEVTAAAFDGTVLYVLDVAGEYVADVAGKRKPVTVKAG